MEHFVVLICLLVIDTAAAEPQISDTVTIQPIQPANGSAACPGQDVTLNCTIIRTLHTMMAMVDLPTMTWSYQGIYNIRSDGSTTSNSPRDIFTATFNGANYTILSIATIFNVTLAYHNNMMQCQLPPSKFTSVSISIAGAANSPSSLSITAIKPPASLTWLAPPNGPTDCAFNYTINITSYSSSSLCYSTSNTESLILTDDLITRGHNYSFAVAVTDSTEQHGPWSDHLTVTYDVPGNVSFMIQSYQTSTINLTWKPPPLIVGFPVLHYVVSYNTSDNSTLIHTQVNSSMTSYTVSGVPGVTYYITVIAVNAVGPGAISDYSIVNVPLTTTSITATSLELFASSSIKITVNSPTTNTSGSIIIIAAPIGGIIAFLLFLVVSLVIIICFVQAKRKKQKKVTCSSNTYSQSFEMRDSTKKTDSTQNKITSIYADLTTPNNDDSMPPPRPPPPVNMTLAKRGEIIYADLGTVPLHNKPAIPPPPVDKVIYSDAREYNPKKENALDRKRPLIYADLGTVPLHNKPAIPPPPVDKVIYSDARDYKPKENTLDRKRPLIYADLGTAPRKQPMAPPLSSHDQVVYSTVNSSTN